MNTPAYPYTDEQLDDQDCRPPRDAGPPIYVGPLPDWLTPPAEDDD